MARVTCRRLGDEWSVHVGKVSIGFVARHGHSWNCRSEYVSGWHRQLTDPPIPTKQQAISRLIAAHREFVKSITIPDDR